MSKPNTFKKKKKNKCKKIHIKLGYHNTYCV